MNPIIAIDLHRLVMIESQFYPNNDETGNRQFQKLKSWFDDMAEQGWGGYTQNHTNLESFRESLPEDIKKIHTYLNQHWENDIVQDIRSLFL